MYPYIAEDSRLHYFDDHGILLTNAGRYMLNDVDVYILEKIDGKKSLDEIVEEIASELGSDKKDRVKDIIMKCIDTKSNCIFMSETSRDRSIKITGVKNNRVPLNLVISLTNKCSLSCTHCFKSCNIEGNDSIDFEKLMDILEFLKGKTSSLQLTGGEPMLYDRFFDVLAFAIENFKTTITTTATMINSNNVKHFKGLDAMQVSIYSDNPELHDKVTQRKGSFNDTIRGVKEAVKHDIPVNGACIATKENINDIESIVKVAIDAGISVMRFGVLIPSGRGLNLKESWCVSESEKSILRRKLSLLSEKYKDAITIISWAEEAQNGKIDEKYESLSCGSGLYRWFISETGNIKPCEFIPDDVYSMGNILENDIRQLVESYTLPKLAPSLKNWEKSLTKDGCTLKDICTVMEDYCSEHCS